MPVFFPLVRYKTANLGLLNEWLNQQGRFFSQLINIELTVKCETVKFNTRTLVRGGEKVHAKMSGWDVVKSGSALLKVSMDWHLLQQGRWVDGQHAGTHLPRRRPECARRCLPLVTIHVSCLWTLIPGSRSSYL